MKQYYYGDMCLTLFENGKYVVSLSDQVDHIGNYSNNKPNFEVNVLGGPEIELGEKGFVLKDILEEDQKLTMGYLCMDEGLYVKTVLEYIPGTNIFVQTNSIKNVGKEMKKITRFSSASLSHVLGNCKEKWYENDEAKIYLCHNKWLGEGQWRIYTPSDLGLYPGSVHSWERASFKIQSTGSWSTANFYPVTILEDCKKGSVWYAEIEGSNNWYIKLCAYGGYAASDFMLEASSCDEGNGGWYYDLKVGETYTAQRTFWGVSYGDFETAVENLNAFKRQDNLVVLPHEKMPLVFNDYMGCVWLDQRPEVLFPLIERAAQIGCEVFCLDSGWFENEFGEGLGDWISNQSIYTEYSLQDIADRISSSGMLPGIWLELETCNPTAFGATIFKEAVLKRYDNKIGGEKWFYNFKCKEVRDYLEGKIDSLYQMGFRYIKNDYNHSMGIGCTNNYEGNSPAEGMIQHNNAFLEFVDYLYVKFPGLIIENCGSGGLRSDNKTLRHFAIQNISDQECYENNPSILSGSAALRPPEKAGILVYPYPTTFANYYNFKPDAAYLESMKDGRQTTFNMISGLMGNLYMSGRIDLCDEYNTGLIKEAIDIYKRNQSEISKSHPIYPTGLCRINEKKIATFGLMMDSKLFLAIWNLHSTGAQRQKIDLKKWINETSKIVNNYPRCNYASFEFENQQLTVEFAKGYAALYIEILL